jgi:aminotransferase EvaB
MREKTKVKFNDPTRKFKNDETLIKRIANFVETGPYINGLATQRFESKFADYIGTKYCIAVGSGTAALDLAINSLELPKDSEILLNAHAGGYGSIAAVKNGMRPKYFDIKIDATPCFESFKKFVSKRTRALILTNLYGQCDDYRKFFSYCRENKIFIIEDCAQSVGAYYSNSIKRAGSQSDISTFSFYPTKNFSTVGDAGAVLTSNTKLGDRIRSLRQYGWSERYLATISEGSNYRMDEIHALVLGHQMLKIDSLNAKRLKIWGTYNRAISGKSLQLLGKADKSFVAHMAVLKSSKINLVKKVLKNNGIETNIHYPHPDYNQPAFSKFKDYELIKTEQHCRSIVSIPMFPELLKSEINLVTKALGEIYV